MALKLATLQAGYPLEPIMVGGDDLNVRYLKPTPAQLDQIREQIKGAGDSLEKTYRINLLPLIASWDFLDLEGNALPIGEESLSLLPYEAQSELLDKVLAATGLKDEGEDQKNDLTPTSTSS